MFGVICSFLVLGCFALLLTFLVTETMSIRTETRLPVFWVSLHLLQVLPDWSCSQSSMGRGGARQGAATQAVMLHGIWLPALHLFLVSTRVREKLLEKYESLRCPKFSYSSNIYIYIYPYLCIYIYTHIYIHIHVCILLILQTK